MFITCLLQVYHALINIFGVPLCYKKIFVSFLGNSFIFKCNQTIFSRVEAILQY